MRIYIVSDHWPEQVQPTRETNLEAPMVFKTVEGAMEYVRETCQNEYDHDVSSALADGDADHGMTPPNLQWEKQKLASAHPFATGTFWEATDHHFETEYRITELFLGV